MSNQIGNKLSDGASGAGAPHETNKTQQELEGETQKTNTVAEYAFSDRTPPPESGNSTLTGGENSHEHTNHTKSTDSTDFNDVRATFNDFQKSIQTNLNAAIKSVNNGIDSAKNAFFDSTPVKTVLENEYTKAGSKYVSDNAMVFGYGMSAAGGYVATDAAIKLLRSETNTNRRREVTKLLVGGGLVGASLHYTASNELDKAALTICALTAGLATATWKAAITPMTYRLFVLKTFTS